MLNRFRAAAAVLAVFCLAATSNVAASSPLPASAPLVAPQMTAIPTVLPAAVAAIADTQTISDSEFGDIEADSSPPARAASLSAMIDNADDSAAMNEDLRCLATAVYFEAKGEPLEGQLAVAQVIVNRAHSGRFPASICGVVYQPSQFSFGHRRVPNEGAQWHVARAIAAIAVAGSWTEIAPAALYFHAARVSPSWQSAVRVARVGNHIFYR